MTNGIAFVVEGKPTGKQRPQFTTIGGRFGRAYTPKKTAMYEELVKAEYVRQCAHVAFGAHTPIVVEIDAGFQIPKSTGKAKREDMAAGRIKPTVKPDADNVAKIICDALNGVAYHDDSQITEITVRKRYAVKNYVAVRIYEAEHEG